VYTHIYYSSAYIDSIVEEQSHEYDVNNPKRNEEEEEESNVLILILLFRAINLYVTKDTSIITVHLIYFLFFSILPKINSSNNVIYIINFCKGVDKYDCMYAMKDNMR